MLMSVPDVAAVICIRHPFFRKIKEESQEEQKQWSSSVVLALCVYFTMNYCENTSRHP